MDLRKRVEHRNGRSVSEPMPKFLISPYLIFGLLLIILALHALAIILGWYSNQGNFDNVHHLLGGFWVAAVFFYFISSRPQIFRPETSFLATVIFGLGFVGLAGIGWELFEFSFDKMFADKNIFPRAQLGIEDTMSDFLFDLGGGLAFILVYFKSLRKN